MSQISRDGISRDDISRDDISRDDVARLARLARLAMTDSELDAFAPQLDAILGYVSQIQAVDVSDVDPAGGAHSPAAHVNVTRPDEIAPSLGQRESLAAAPASADGRFAVPQILGESQ